MKTKNILKVTVTLIIAMILMSQISIAATTGTINYDTVRVREKPDASSDIVGLTSIGDKVQVLEKSGNWYKITCEYEGKQITGYIRGDLIDVKDESQLQQNNTTVDNNSNVPTTEEPANTSTEPNTNDSSGDSEEQPSNLDGNQASETPDSNQQGETVVQPSNSDDKSNEQIENQSETTLTTLKISQGQLSENTTIVLTSNINIKILPVVNSTNIATITAGTSVKIVEVLNQWVRIESGDQIGWARIGQ